MILHKPLSGNPHQELFQSFISLCNSSQVQQPALSLATRFAQLTSTVLFILTRNSTASPLFPQCLHLDSILPNNLGQLWVLPVI